ncbi:FAD-binding protein [Desulfotignum balticum]|uniref:FAD-binding protein n=1 Tax=Desulfotignum balticum TaxID=115781 RepID=UPI0003FE7D12|nr:FAD-binding protein [Desulfotignum balticum]
MPQLSESYLSADTLIIGGGSAGIMAAIRAKELNPQNRVVVFDKADVKYSGSIPRGMDALNIVAIPGESSVEGFIESASNSRERVIDENVSRAIAARSWDLLKKLESWGVCFPKGDSQGYEALTTHSKGKYTVTMKEPNLKKILYDKVSQSDTIILNRTMALELLIDNDRVVGAVGMNVRTGEFIICYAKAVILASGGAARFGLPDNGHLYGIYDCPANSGDSYYLAYSAGAELTGMECTVCYVIVKDINCPLLHPTMTRGGKLIDIYNNELDFGKDSLISALPVEHFMKHGGYIRLRLSHLPEETIKTIESILFTTERPILERFFKGRNLNFRNCDIELAPTEFYLCGGHGITGLRIDETAASTIPGLYAAGDAAHGQGYLTGAFTLGQIAAESADSYADSIEQKMHFSTAKTYMKKIESFIQKIQNNENKITVEEFEYKVRRLINNYVAPPKNEYKLNRALEMIGQMQHELEEVVQVKTTHDIVKAFEIRNIITCALLSASAALERKESRWGWWHYRSDFPEKNEQYEKHVIVKKDNDTISTCLKNTVKINFGGGKSNE